MPTVCSRTPIRHPTRSTARVYLRPILPVPAAESLLSAAPQPVTSDSLGDLCRQAAELEAARRREEELRRQAASSIVVPQGGLPPMPGGGGKIQMP